jgi:hypothetical protein
VTVPLLVDVVRVALEPPDATPFLYHSPYLPGKHFAAQRRIAAQDMADHDVNPIIYLDARIDPNTFDVDVRDLPMELGEFQELGILPPEPRVGVIDNAAEVYGRLCPGADLFAAPCPEFDSVYRGALRTYRSEFEAFGVTPVLSFTDEPGAEPERRAVSNYLNRLTKGVGLRTWVTYYPECERPLAGHTSCSTTSPATCPEPCPSGWQTIRTSSRTGTSRRVRKTPLVMATTASSPAAPT